MKIKVAKDRAEKKEEEEEEGGGVVCCSREVEKVPSWSEGVSGDLKAAAQVIRETGIIEKVTDL